MNLNCDMGESFGNWHMGNDEAIMPFIDQANIACGFHAGDPGVMTKTVALAREHHVQIGAHPGYPDLQGFGRREMAISAEEIRDMLWYQIGALDGICNALGTRISYVKPHGALYNRMAKDTAVMQAVMQAVKSYSAKLPLMIMATPENDQMRALANSIGIDLIFEAFSDRQYDDTGRLMPRSEARAVHRTMESIQSQVTQLLEHRCVTTAFGNTLPVDADSVCIHGDGDHAVENARHARTVLERLG